jgi:hypothetical protein
MMCMTWTHEPPACSHDPSRSCKDCGKPVGYRLTADDGGKAGSPFQCAPCYWVAQPAGGRAVVVAIIPSPRYR